MESIWDIDGELLKLFISIHLCFVGYTSIGLIINEEKVQDWFWRKRSSSDSYHRLENDLAMLGDGDDRVDDIVNYKDISAINFENLVASKSFGSSEHTLIAKNISKDYKGSTGIKRALSNFSLMVKKGEIFGLLGPNGAGKTTFLNIITGRFRPTTGEFSIPMRAQGYNALGFCP